MHFSVMVFGDDVEQQLAPFQETNMGPIAPEYMQKIDYTDDVRELFEAPQQYFLLKRWSLRGLWLSTSPRTLGEDSTDARGGRGGDECGRGA